MRKVVVAIAAILLLAGGSMLAVYLVSRDPGAPPPLPPPPPAAAEAPPAPGALPLTALLAAPPPAAPLPPPVAYGPPPPEPQAGSWEAVAPVARLGRLGPAGAALNVRINELQPRISACFATAQARGGTIAGGDQYTETRDYGQPADSGGATVLMLEVEATRNGVRIVDAPVESAGGASAGAIACVQGLLRGQVVPAAGARPGERYRVLHTLTQ